MPASQEPHVRPAVAWYRENQWDRLRELSADRDDLHATYAEWRAMAETRSRELIDRGIDLCRVDVDVELLWAWCCANGRALDGSARSEYAAILSRDLTEREQSE